MKSRRIHLHDPRIRPDPRALLIEELGVCKDDIDVVDELLDRSVGAFGHFGLFASVSKRRGSQRREGEGRRRKREETNGDGIEGHGMSDDLVVLGPLLLVGEGLEAIRELATAVIAREARKSVLLIPQSSRNPNPPCIHQRRCLCQLPRQPRFDRRSSLGETSAGDGGGESEERRRSSFGVGVGVCVSDRYGLGEREGLLRSRWGLLIGGLGLRRHGRGSIVVLGSFGFARDVRVPLFEDFL